MSSKQAGKGDSNFRRTLKQNASESEGDVAGSIALELPPKKQKTISPSTLTATVTVRKSKVVAVRKSSTDIPRIQRKLAALWPNSSSIIMQIVRNRRTRVEKDGASSQGWTVNSRRRDGCLEGLLQFHDKEQGEEEEPATPYPSIVTWGEGREKGDGIGVEKRGAKNQIRPPATSDTPDTSTATQPIRQIRQPATSSATSSTTQPKRQQRSPATSSTSPITTTKTSSKPQWTTTLSKKAIPGVRFRGNNSNAGE